MLIGQAYEFLAEGCFEDAVKTFSGCLSWEPPKAEIYRGRGMAYFQLKNWKLAVTDFEKARQLDYEDPINWMALALALAMDSKIYEAIDVYETLLAYKPRLIRAHIQLALLYYRLGIINKGHYQLDLALDFGPSLDERKRIVDLKNEQLALDKKRYYRPDFQALREQNQVGSFSFLKEIAKFFAKPSRSVFK